MMDLIEATVHSVYPLTDSILQISLQPLQFHTYLAGQYLQIHHQGKAYPFSIANAPLGSHKLELHIRHSRDNPYNDEILMAIRQQGKVLIEYPNGDCHVEKLLVDKPIVFIAQGTGFSPVKAIIEQLLADGDKRPMHLFWGARSKNDLYLEERVMQWQSHVAHFEYTPVLSGSGFLHDVVVNNYAPLLESQVIAAGAFDMVYKARDAFIKEGFDANHMFSDAFSFE